ncbi:ornithine cyclodeaminase [Psychromonas sp. Urea-02u-13]|uniref:ornithine cyclodeaminase n=1 Tax=Psychromonas sp. Urea-02u-13 TaxID=2058326 RepID=UPI000C3268A4|nr:ornithine cyclodeaminase [Psychromonas sp. Urea-02u-13]PKG38209.1 ornithine cyclodeaminase [Psychromonas sp. Urea-02u-13]
MLVLQLDDIKKLLAKIGYKDFFLQLIDALESDYKQWFDFDKKARIGNHFDYGVIELMPISNQQYYAFKYVNGHPKNPLQKKLTVMATGQLSLCLTGEPILYSEMTLLTALRTAATSAMVAKHIAKKDAKVLTLIGTGAQSEFQFIAYSFIFDLQEVRYFDSDEKAMQKFARNMASFNLKLTPCNNAAEAVQGADLITTCTADKCRQTILTKAMIDKPVFINALGGDCPGKTELEKTLLESATIVAEYLPQTKVEGEIQQLDADFECTELHQIIKGEVAISVEKNGTVIYDSVGFALEDYVILKLVYQLATQYKLGNQIDIVPDLDDVKDLFSLTK